MGLSSDALYSMIQLDVLDYLPLGPVDPRKLPPDVSYKQFVSTSLVYDVIRKWIPSDSSLADRASKETFLTSNKKCEAWSFQPKDSIDDLLFGQLIQEIDHFFLPSGTMLFDSYFDFFRNSRVGPGAAVSARGCSLYAKLFASPLTTTSNYLYSVYRDFLSWFPEFEEAERHRYSTYGSPKVIGHSRSSFVPKTSTASRMICVEPSLNMFIQLGFGTILEERLSRFFGITLETQPDVNRRLAYIGSKTGQFSTIDLSSASDSLSVNLMRAILPPFVFDTLMELRSPSTLIDNECVPLHMISTMGNGFTFPLQTIIFSAVIRACYKIGGLNLQSGSTSNWSCFGDDMIVDTSMYRSVIRLLSLIGCSVNSSKTFFEGPFRESCGSDWFYGQPVRSAFVKALRSPQDITVAINLLNAWSAYTGIPLVNGISYLLSGLKHKCFVPFEENDDAGIRVPSSLIRTKHDSNLSYIYSVLQPIPAKIRISDGQIRCPKGVKKLVYNPSGLYISFLYGEVTQYSISVRHDRPRYRRKTRCTPRWDYIPLGMVVNGTTLLWRQWETAVLINLSNL